MKKEQKRTTERLQPKNRGHWLAVGIAIGTGMGVALNNIAMGIGLGVAIGCALIVFQKPKNRRNDLHRNHRNDSGMGKASEFMNLPNRSDGTLFSRWRSRNSKIS